MNNKRFWFCWAGMLSLTALAAWYPLRMGISVIRSMVQSGAVPLENYPKYVIPYTPIALALLVGVLLMPLLQKLPRRSDLLVGLLCAFAVFLVAERLMETKILVQTTELVKLESWQMALCYQPPEFFQTRTWEAVDILLGGYSPAFKLHFYLVSTVILISLLNSLYGFGRLARGADQGRGKALTVQTIAGLAFVGMCIWACFTAFYRGGELTVSPLSALLMAVFFLLMGVTGGCFIGSLTLDKRRSFSVLLPAVAAVLLTLTMYAGEMILLSGNLYRFGTGFLFEGMGKLVLAPVDIIIILAAGTVTALLCIALNRRNTGTQNRDLYSRAP